MGKDLDLNDVVCGHPLAKRELTLALQQARREALEDAATYIEARGVIEYSWNNEETWYVTDADVAAIREDKMEEI